MYQSNAIITKWLYKEGYFTSLLKVIEKIIHNETNFLYGILFKKNKSNPQVMLSKVSQNAIIFKENLKIISSNIIESVFQA